MTESRVNNLVDARSEEEAPMPETTLSALEARLRMVEDRLEILNLIASHPPSADTGADYYTVQVYTEDGVFDRGANLMGATGNQAIADILQTPGHQAAIHGGLAHFASPPHIAIDGDEAVVTSYL